MPPIVRLLSLTTTAGLLKDVTFDPAKALTCIIGNPGSGKSTIVETLGFVIGRDPKWVNMLLGLDEKDYSPNHPEFGRLEATLAGGSAVARLEVDYGTSTEVLRVERNASDHAPRVYKDGTDEPGDPSVLECFEIYSQGDTQRISEDTRRRLALLDRRERTKLRALQTDLGLASTEVTDLDREYALSVEQLESQDLALEPLKDRRERLAFLQKRRPPAPPELEAEREKHDARQLVLVYVETRAEERTRLLSRLHDAAREETVFRETLEALGGYRLAEAREVAAPFVAFADLLKSVGSATQVQKTIDTRPLIEKLRSRFEELDKPYHKLQEKQQAVAAAQREEDQLRLEVQRLERIEAERRKTEERRQDLKKRRDAARAKFRQIKSQIFKIRQKLAQEINEQFKDLVQVVVHHDAYTPPEYRAAIADLIYGCHFQHQERLATDLSRVPPVELITAVEEHDPKFLAAYLERDTKQMKRLIEWLVEKTDKEIYSLERFVFDDDLEISLNENGRWRPIRELSRGKKALALLPIILMDGTDLLAADQLEDAINNRLIMQTLVTRSQGLERQAILVTHNANIALLTKAERVIVLEDEGGKVRVVSGTVTEEGTRYVLDLLEGGPGALKRRVELYGRLLADGEDGPEGAAKKK